jgi:hypothetical protein
VPVPVGVLARFNAIHSTLRDARRALTVLIHLNRQSHNEQRSDLTLVSQQERLSPGFKGKLKLRGLRKSPDLSNISRQANR